MHMRFVEIVAIGNLEPQPGEIDFNLIVGLPVIGIGIQGHLENTGADKVGQLFQLGMRRVLIKQIVTAGVSLLWSALLLVAMLVK